MKVKFVLLALAALGAPGVCQAATACQDLAAYVRGQGGQGIQWNWKGAETSGQVYTAWRADVPEPSFKPLFQDQRERLLKEAKQVAPGMISDWQALLSPTSSDFPAGESLTLEELKDGSVGVMRATNSGNPSNEARSYYYRDLQGLVHVAGPSPAFPTAGAWRKYAWVAAAAKKGGETLIRLNDKVLVISDAPATGGSREVFAVSQWQDSHMDRQCLMDVNYEIHYERETAFDNPSRQPSDKSQFLATYVDGWGHYYRRAFDVDGAGNAMKASQKALVDDFTKKHPSAVANIGLIIKTIPQGTVPRLYYPVLFQGQAYVVAIEQGFDHGAFQDNLTVSLFGLEAGKALQQAQLNAVVKRVALTDIGFVYLDKASSRVNTSGEASTN